MKTLVKDGVSVYLFSDDKVVNITATHTEIGSPVELIAGDCNSSNSAMHTGVTAPENWMGTRYLFDGTTWSANPKWVDHTAKKESE
tara:strand:+ start:74 stop:331 length:258 start_codon:yes stop_codon:yes gene_type:complete